MPFYSPSTGGFYDEAIHGDAIPADAVKITAKRHAALLAAQAEGATIVAGAKGPVAKVERMTAADWRAKRARELKAAARRRILAIATLEQQSNDNAELALAALQMNAEGGCRIDFAPALERRRKIDELRACCNQLERGLAVLSIEQLQNFDAGACRWPAH